MHTYLYRFAVVISILFGFTLSQPAVSEGQQNAGTGRFFTNDFIGDGQDRWNTASYAVSIMRGPTADDTVPDVFGRLFEHRLRGAVIAPANLANPAAGDRPYAGVLSYGVHSYTQRGTTQNRLGLDLVAVGPQTGIGDFHGWLHDAINAPEPDLSAQLANAIYPTVSGEIARPLQLGNLEVRPFAEAQVGVETFARVGADISLGSLMADGVRLRDVTTGHLYETSTVDQSAHGSEFILGADVAHVWSSEYLPASDGYALEPFRLRGRAGVKLSGPQADVFYGVSWLSPEFKSQPEGQVVGSLNVSLQF
ncbi:lipid A-modifier LpxR family protein [Pacificibacter marinus]|uniref:Lipid A deacylase LpxR family protein n=1 Tax=Pacificibacter marinus TaxID=658057 RepID=A0A1Y5RCX1_9RHOB|nr:lipid A-modifier LpxR family protein [Pacificibacter marinus]SEK27431.1 hypothetical protein SAMN04488032_101561 [Pacificibacter marinus]SLN11759.1 hypothetical protein PAM7971_00086 [Pacificibacter marinus]